MSESQRELRRRTTLYILYVAAVHRQLALQSEEKALHEIQKGTGKIARVRCASNST